MPIAIARLAKQKGVKNGERITMQLRHSPYISEVVLQMIDCGDRTGRLGTLEVRLARNAAEVRRAQRLRYRVFYKEGSASADAKTMLARRLPSYVRLAWALSREPEIPTVRRVAPSRSPASPRRCVSCRPRW